MAIRASLQIGQGFVRLDRFGGRRRKILRNFRIRRNSCCPDVVVIFIIQRVTGKTHDRLDRLEQLSCNGTVWRVTRQAIFDDRRVFENPWTHNILMAFGAELGVTAIGYPRIFVGIVAAGTSHTAFSYRMVRRKIKLRRDISVAFDTKSRRKIHVSRPRL